MCTWKNWNGIYE